MDPSEQLEIETGIGEVLKTIFDPEIPVNIYDLGLIYDINLDEEHVAHITMTLTAPNCPMADELLEEVKYKVGGTKGVKECDLKLTFNPPWDRNMLSDEAKLELGFLQNLTKMAASFDPPLSVLIKEKAQEIGFDLCGIAASRPLAEREDILKNWCTSGMNAGMNYLARDLGKRINPESLVPGAKSLIVTGLNYYTDNRQTEPGVPVLSRYAYGEAYQDVIKRKLNELLVFIKSMEPEAEGRPFSDSAPLLEKAWAVEAGIGWQGKHSVVINKTIGSFFFIGILILNIELEYDKPVTWNYCGNCRLCIEQCPTGAINEDNTIDARKCIANLTIENRGPIPDEIIPRLEGRVYGCDRCQEVCPWNGNALQHKVPEFQIEDELAKMSADEWSALSRERFKRLFKKTPVGRKKYETFMENVAIVSKQRK